MSFSSELSGYDPWASSGPSLVFIKFYWNTGMPVCLHTIYGCFYPLDAELARYSRDHRACRADDIYYLALFRKGLLIPALGHRLMKKLHGHRICRLSTIVDTASFSFLANFFLQFSIFYYENYISKFTTAYSRHSITVQLQGFIKKDEKLLIILTILRAKSQTWLNTEWKIRLI